MRSEYLLMKTPFAEKSYLFALKVVAECRLLMNEKREFILSKQLIQSGTAVGALYREAQHAESRADFIHKLAIAQKECNESLYWIDVLHDSRFLDDSSHSKLHIDCLELMKMLTAMLKTAKSRG